MAIICCSKLSATYFLFFFFFFIFGLIGSLFYCRVSLVIWLLWLPLSTAFFTGVVGISGSNIPFNYPHRKRLWLHFSRKHNHSQLKQNATGSGVHPHTSNQWIHSGILLSKATITSQLPQNLLVTSFASLHRLNQQPHQQHSKRSADANEKDQTRRSASPVDVDLGISFFVFSL